MTKRSEKEWNWMARTRLHGRKGTVGDEKRWLTRKRQGHETNDLNEMQNGSTGRLHNREREDLCNWKNLHYTFDAENVRQLPQVQVGPIFSDFLLFFFLIRLFPLRLCFPSPSTARVFSFCRWTGGAESIARKGALNRDWKSRGLTVSRAWLDERALKWPLLGHNPESKSEEKEGKRQLKKEFELMSWKKRWFENEIRLGLRQRWLLDAGLRWKVNNRCLVEKRLRNVGKRWKQFRWRRHWNGKNGKKTVIKITWIWK